jgi:hypothetical protein
MVTFHLVLHFGTQFKGQAKVIINLLINNKESRKLLSLINKKPCEL